MTKIPEEHIIRVVKKEKGKAYIDGMSVCDFLFESYNNGSNRANARAKIRRDLAKGVIVTNFTGSLS